jgi:HD-GYP domain-containing protein (c-di-GMP phosphodiesterase class II)
MVCGEAAEVLNAPGALLLLQDPGRGVLVPAATHGLPPSWTRSYRPLPRRAYDALLAKRGPLFVIPDVRQESGLPHARLHDRCDIRTKLVATLDVGGEFVGILILYTFGEPRRFSAEQLELLQGFADHAALAIVNARLHADSKQRLRRLESLRALDLAVTASVDTQVILSVLLDQVTAEAGVDAACVLLSAPYTQSLDFAAGKGFLTTLIESTRIPLGDCLAGRAALRRSLLYCNDLRVTDDAVFRRRRLLQEERFVAYCAVPLVRRGKVSGVLEIFRRAEGEFEPEWLEFIESLARRAAVALDNASLVAQLRRAKDGLVHAYDVTLAGWAMDLEQRGIEASGHNYRVAANSVALGRSMGLDGEDLEHLRRGALLHDIGQTGMPDSVFLKPGPLSYREKQLVRQHPIRAQDLLSSVDYLRPALEVAFCHHERLDGEGYPRGLRGGQIPLAARIFSVVDVWDSLLSDRPYRPAWSKEKAVEHILDRAGHDFDRDIAATFLALVNRNEVLAPTG